MKKVLAIVLMLTMVLSVVGCQANGNNDVNPTQAPDASAVPATTEPAQVEQTKAGYPWWILVICIFGGCGWGVAIMLIIPKLKKKKD